MFDDEPTPAQERWAFGLGIVTLLCLLGAIASYVLTVVLVRFTGDDAPPFFPGIIFVWS